MIVNLLGLLLLIIEYLFITIITNIVHIYFILSLLNLMYFYFYCNIASPISVFTLERLTLK